MKKSTYFILPLLFCSLFPFVDARNAARTADGSEQWGYVEVRPGAHLFWWLYRSPRRVDNASTPWPTIMWLQGGPGSSGVGLGNFQEIGPLNTELKPRNSTWLQKADLLFVDNPVGTGYSFVENASLFVKNDWEAAADLTSLLKKLYNEDKAMQKSPLFIIAESYGGKFAVTAGLSINKAIKARELKLKLGGIALGNSWMSPEDYVLSWGPLLRDVSRIDINPTKQANIMAEKIKEQIEKGQYNEATNSWGDLEYLISENSNQVDFYNFLLDSSMDPLSLAAVQVSEKSMMKLTVKGYISSKTIKRYTTYLSSKASSNSFNLSSFMNGVIKEKLKIIPKNVSWEDQSLPVFNSLSHDFMKPRINEVDELLSLGISVTIYNGQLDLICSTKGTEAWVQKLKWEGLNNFNNSSRSTLYCTEEAGVTKGFFKSYQNLHFYWILMAGHFVPVDQPCISLQMISNITQSPAASS